ncbi:MAG: flagellar export chaperone FliS [Synergistales bacterium]|nr:flagellar export chaperone FliS [Synergistales bacterium]
MSMSMQDAQNAYQTNQIQTASREQLLLLTYDIGIRACLHAEKAIEARDVESSNTLLKKAQDVIRELMVTLDTENGGDFAQQLMSLYEFMFYQLVEANVEKTGDKVASVREMLQELRDTWKEAMDQMADQQPKESQWSSEGGMYDGTATANQQRRAPASVPKGGGFSVAG